MAIVACFLLELSVTVMAAGKGSLLYVLMCDDDTANGSDEVMARIKMR